MNIEIIRDKFKKGEKVFCTICKSEINVYGDRETGRVVGAECPQNPGHYSVIVNVGSIISKMFKDASEKKLRKTPPED